ncbi:hypothetical protein DL93DRAFT_53868 [Clavulina sp. PMI_390]|nr:hypothetical protein DL93DRAFT_53868 [Clavulina sp. PMI_390]
MKRTMAAVSPSLCQCGACYSPYISPPLVELWVRKQSDVAGTPVRSPRASQEHSVHFRDDVSEINSVANREVNREMDSLMLSSAPRTPITPLDHQNEQAQRFSSPPPQLTNYVTYSQRPMSPPAPSGFSAEAPPQMPAGVPEGRPLPQPSSPRPPESGPRDYSAPSSPTAAGSRIPSGSFASTSPTLPPPKLNLSNLNLSSGPPSPSGTPGKISASAFRRPFNLGKKSSTLGPDRGDTLAGPPYSTIPAGEPPTSDDVPAPAPAPNNMSSNSLASNGPAGTTPLNLRSKRTLPASPYPNYGLPPGALPPGSTTLPGPGPAGELGVPRPLPVSNASAATTATGDQGFYTPPTEPSGGAYGANGAGYNFPPPASYSQPQPEEGAGAALNRVPAPAYSMAPRGALAIGDIPDEAEFMRELENDSAGPEHHGQGLQ